MRPVETTVQWLTSGDENFPAMLAAVAAAREDICLEIYIYTACPLGERVREALIGARRRGVRVRVLLDSFGSVTLKHSFFEPLIAAGGEVRWFNPLSLRRFSVRNHRKLLVCDQRVAFIGGFNISSEYEGDGVTRGWYDIGVRIEGPLVEELARSFEELFALHDFRHRRFMRFRKFIAKRIVRTAGEQLLLSGPGRGANPIKRGLHRDLAQAREVKIMVSYFLPSWRLRRRLMKAARRGASVQLLLPGKSDVAISQLAGRNLYRRLLRAGVQIAEYQPQILHAKLFMVDGAVYVGSANLDVRSRVINYELMVRFGDAGRAVEAAKIFERCLSHSAPIELEAWRRTNSFWSRLKQRWAYFVLARIDPYVALHQLRTFVE